MHYQSSLETSLNVKMKTKAEKSTLAPGVSGRMANPRMKPQHSFGELVYSYARFSTKKQSLGDSERRQQENAQHWAKEHGCKITYIIDPGIRAEF
jgi:hypothetical protein